MRVFVTGASGFIGSAIVQELLGTGHQVVGLARSDASAEAVTAAGAQVHRGSLEDLEGLKRGVAACDGVIHTAFIHDFSSMAAMAASAQTDRLAVEAMGAALTGSGRPLVIASGTALLTPGRVVTEEEASDPNAPGLPRLATEGVTLALAAQGVRSSVVRLPPSVHGKGDHAFVPAFIATARATGVSAYVGEGLNRWCAVHRLDAARLFRLALEKGPAGSKFHGVADEAVAFKAIAEVIGRRLNVPVVAKSRDEAVAHFGLLGHFAGLDCPASSALTQARLGWHPTQPGLIADLDQPYYFQA